MLSRKELREKKGIAWTPQYLSRLERSGKFPRRRYLGSKTPVWVENEIDQWLRKLPKKVSQTAIIKSFTIDIVRHAKTDLLLAFSNGLPGLLVPARGEEELRKRLEGAIRELLQVQGATEIILSLQSEPSELPSDFIPSRFKVRASLQLPASACLDSRGHGKFGDPE